MISGLSDMFRSPKTNIMYLRRPQDTLKTQENPKAIFGNSLFMNLENVEIKKCENVGRQRTIMTIRLISF